MDDLRVESYDSKEVAAKKKSIAKRAAMAGKTTVLALGLFGLMALPSGCEDIVFQPDQEIEDYEDYEDWYPTPGGAGSWYVSIIENL